MPENRLSILGVRPMMTDAEVLAVLGKPDSYSDPTPIPSGDSVFTWHWQPRFVQASFHRHRVFNFQCHESRCMTADSIRVGASKDDVRRVYGPGRKGNPGPGADILRYYSSQEDCHMTFSFFESHVQWMYLECKFPP